MKTATKTTILTIYFATDEGRAWARKARDIVPAMGEVTSDNIADLFMNGVYARTATLEVEGEGLSALEEAYAWTQNDNPEHGTKESWKPRTRSSMVGDIFETPDGTRYVVAGSGFTRL